MPRERNRRSADSWLHALHLQLRPLFRENGYKLPPHFQFHVGWPKGKNALAEIHRNGSQEERRPLKKLSGVVHAAESVRPYTVFIIPTIDNPLLVASAMVHELIHGALPPTLKGHPRPFQDACRKLGMVMTHKNGHTKIDTGEHIWHDNPKRGVGTKESDAPPGSHQGHALLALLTEITNDLGPYPHKAIPGRIPGASRTRHGKAIKFRCPECKAFVVRIGPSALWINDQYCAPLCGNPSCCNYAGARGAPMRDGSGKPDDPLFSSAINLLK
jgi:hypothetical protein